MSGEDRAAAEDALKDKLIESPAPLTGEWAFLKDRAIGTKEDTEEELGETFPIFEPVKFIKRDFNYVIRVNCGNQYVDLYMREKLLNDIKAGKSAGDPMNFS